MRVALLADGRSPITQGWLASMTELGYEVHLISTFPCSVDLPLASLHHVPVAFSGFRRSKAISAGVQPGGAAAIRLRTHIRQWLGMLTFPEAIRRLRHVMEVLNVDLLHALRIPFEGMLAAYANPEVPLILSVWGNDFTLHARSTPWMGWLTRHSLQCANGLHADCKRDIALSEVWGFRPGRPTTVLPGGGGIDRKVFRPGMVDLDLLKPELRSMLKAIPADTPLVINPRGFRAYVRNDTFFKSIPIILRSYPQAIFLAPAMQGEARAQHWLNRLGLAESVRLLPTLSRQEMAVMYQRSQVMVSPSEHDGTPNSFLEAIACGCFPVVGDLDSLREWVQAGQNGLLVDPGSPEELAYGVIKALSDPKLRRKASEQNQGLIDDRAEQSRVVSELDRFYQKVVAD
jgi:glycosyltransferase involved in cell wall biosynthesis